VGTWFSTGRVSAKRVVLAVISVIIKRVLLHIFNFGMLLPLEVALSPADNMRMCGAQDSGDFGQACMLVGKFVENVLQASVDPAAALRSITKLGTANSSFKPCVAARECACPGYRFVLLESQQTVARYSVRS
jgi:hypothetical protein